MQRITANSSVEEVMANIGVGPQETLRESEKRQMMLRKFAQMRSRNPNVSLTIEETPTAFVKVDEELDEFVDITVTSKLFEQQETDLPDKYHDYIVQKAFCAHEVGHVLYSDYPALQTALDQVEHDETQYEGIDKSEAKSYKLMFQNFANVLEDGAIENYLAKEFRLGEELEHLRSTLHEGRYFGQEYPIDGRKEYHYPFFFAVMTAALNLGVYDNGELDKLLDEDNEQHIFAVRGGEVDREMFLQDVIPLLRSRIPKIHSETDADERMVKIYELWTEIRKYIDRSQTSGRIEFEQQQKQAESDSYMEGVPENLSEGHGEQDTEPAGDVEVVSVSGGDEESDEGEEEVSGGDTPGDRDETSHENKGGGSELEERAEEGLVAETKQESGDWSDEIEEIINALGAGEGTKEIAIAEDGVVDEHRLHEAERLSKRTERLFARKLRHLNKDKVVRNKERGEFDSRALIPAERGSTRTFKQVKQGQDKNYSCMIVVDRSGSMSGSIKDVELAVGAIAWGLEENGVDTCILDTESSMTTLSKPFGTSTDSFKEKIFAGRCSGGTPLSGTMQFARQRMQRGEGDYPFAIVITDGRPSDTSQFKEEVAKANFPVLGLYMTNSKSGVESQLSLYDRAVISGKDDDVNQQLISLINNIIF